MVGKLQTNKVKFLLPLFDYLHSVDNEKLAKKISVEQLKHEKKIKIFIQVNIGDENQKSGVNQEALEDLYNYCIKLNLDIEFEDDFLLIVNKPPNMVVHPGHGNYSGTLVNGLIYRFSKLPNNSNDRPGLVHRIDKDTSGLLVVAKTEKSMTFLTKQFYEKSILREYHALVWGNIEKDKGRIEVNIGRNPRNRLQMTTFSENDKGKSAITNFEVIKRYGYVTHVKCILEYIICIYVEQYFTITSHPKEATIMLQKKL